MPLVQRTTHGRVTAHPVDHVFPPLSVRQWVLSVPARIAVSAPLRQILGDAVVAPLSADPGTLG